MIGKSTVLFLLFWLVSTSLLAQGSENIAARLGYPQLVVYNAKIITVDDPSVTSRLGTIAQAMAIRDQKVLAVGSNGEMRGLAGPETQLLDLGGRTVVPGFILGHNHPWDYTASHPEIMRLVPEEIAVHRFLSGPPREQIEQFPQVLAEAVRAAKPGAWVRIIMLLDETVSPEDPWIHFAGTRITKAQLDQAAPNNPVEVRTRDVIIRQGRESIVNQRAVELMEKTNLPPDFLEDLNNFAQEKATGVLSSLIMYRMVLPQFVLKDHPDLYMELMRLALSWWTATGQTTVGGFLYHQAPILRAYRLLDRQGRLPARVAWGWGELPLRALERDYQDPFFVTDLATREGTGTDHMWYYGTGEIGGGCVSIEPIVERPQVIRGGSGNCQPERLAYGRGRPKWNAMFEVVKAGGRLMGSHQSGDVDIDNIMNLIEEASKEGGLDAAEIRARRHTADHMQGWPRPDQIPRIKDLGMIVGGTNLYIHQDSPLWLRDYGEKALDWVVPRKSILDAGIMQIEELDKPYFNTNANVFTALSWSISRKAMDGKVYAADQKISREVALKTGTIWPAYYVLKEDVLGSLERGKFADFLVLDRDYLTVPEEEIGSIRVLMTMVGGKIEHLAPSLAKGLSLEARGAQVELGGPAANY